MNLLCQELGCLLRCTTNKVLWIKQSFDLFACHAKCRIACDQLYQVILVSILLHLLTRDHRILTDLLMQLLTISATLYGIHHDVLGCHERNLLHEMLVDHLVIYDKSIYDIQVQIQNTIDGKECFRYRNSLVCRIIQCTLKPLCTCHNCRI